MMHCRTTEISLKLLFALHVPGPGFGSSMVAGGGITFDPIDLFKQTVFICRKGVREGRVSFLSFATIFLKYLFSNFTTECVES